MASWISTDISWPEKPIQVIEYFAGVSRICKLASWYGFEARGFELNYDTPPGGTSSHSKMPCRSSYDLCGEAGFLFFDGTVMVFNQIGFRGPTWAIINVGFANSWLHPALPKSIGLSEPVPLTTRLAVVLVLQCRFGDLFAMMAPVCSSFSTVNIASSCRSLLTPLGRTSSTSVRRGNILTTRRGRVWKSTHDVLVGAFMT